MDDWPFIFVASLFTILRRWGSLRCAETNTDRMLFSISKLYEDSIAGRRDVCGLHSYYCLIVNSFSRKTAPERYWQ